MNSMKRLRDRLTAGETVLIDGGVGSEIERQGGAMVEGAWCGVAAVTDPEVVQAVHETYLNLGAQVTIANNFATARYILTQAGWGDRVEEVNRRGVELALAARAATGKLDTVVAGTISTTHQEGVLPSLTVMADHLTEAAEIQAEAGAELMILEMMRKVDSTEVALEAAKATGLPVWLGWSCVEGDNGPVLVDSGESLEDAMRWTAEQEGIDLVAIMHTQTAETAACIDIVNAHWDGPTGVYAHTGIFEPPHWRFEGTISPDDYAHAAQGWRDQGVQVLGGCCGIGPAHLNKLSDLCLGPGQ